MMTIGDLCAVLHDRFNSDYDAAASAVLENYDGLVRKLTGSDEDLMQQVWLKVFLSFRRRLLSFSCPEKFTGWLRQVCKSVVIDQHRRQSVRIASLDFDPTHTSEPSEMVDMEELLTVVVKSFKPLRRSILLLLMRNGNNVADAAKRLNMTTSNILWHRQEIIRRLCA